MVWRLVLFIISIPAAAQYGCVPGDVPPLPAPEQLSVEVSPPYQSAISLPGISDDDAARLEHPEEDEIIYWTEGIKIGCVPDADGCTYVFMGMWGFNLLECDNVATVCQLSPSGRYFAVGADGTSVLRGPVYVFDMATGERFRTSPSGVWNCSEWIEGDYLLIETAGYSESSTGFWENDNLGSLPWLNLSYLTEAEGSFRNFVLYNGGSSWMVLPEDSCYSYTGRGFPSISESTLVFDVVATPNLIPRLAGINTRAEFNDWIDSMGGFFPAFPEYDFRVYLDTGTNSVVEIAPMEPAMVVEGFLGAMRAGDVYGMLDYVTAEQRSTVTDSQMKDVQESIGLFSELEYLICNVSTDGNEAAVECEISLPGYVSMYSFGLLRVYGRWLIDSL